MTSTLAQKPEPAAARPHEDVCPLSPLSGVRVLECTSGLAGAVAAMFLADFGADVVKLEPKNGDTGRRDPGFSVWNRNKRSVRVAQEGPIHSSAEVPAWLARADVCVVSESLTTLAGSPLDPNAAVARHPELVMVHVAPFLASAPWAGGAGSEALMWASSGLALRQASEGGGPVDLLVPCLSVVQGVWAAAGAVAALLERDTSGRGQVVTAAGAHAMAIAGAAAYTFDSSAVDSASPGPRVGGSGGPIPFYRTYQCRDGKWLFLAALTPHFTQRAFAALGLAGLPEDPRLEGGGRAAILLPHNAAWVIEEMAGVFARRDRDEWLEILSAAGCPAGPLLSRTGWLDHPQMRAIGMRREVEENGKGRVVMPGLSLNLTESPAEVRSPAPSLADLSPPVWSRIPVNSLGSDGNPETKPGPGPRTTYPTASGAKGPLAGIHVLDLGAIIAGPFAGSLLAELGADVVKVEPPSGDSFRGPGFGAYNKGQRGIALDLQQPTGRQALLDLVVSADVVIDNYRPGVLGRLGLTYEDLKAVNPAIVTVTITGFGAGGPLENEAGFDPVFQAMSGMMTAQGGHGEPVFMTVPVNDVTAATVAALGACLALYHRTTTGSGQAVWTSLAAMSALLQSSELVRYDGRAEPRIGGRDFLGPADTDRFYRTADGWVRIQDLNSVARDGLDSPGSIAPGLGPLARALGCAPDDLEASLGDLSSADAAARLNSGGIPTAAVRVARQLVEDPDAMSFDLFHPDPRPGRSSWWTPGRQIRFSRTERQGTLVAPALGQHTRAVLLEAGIERAVVEEMMAKGAAVASHAKS